MIPACDRRSDGRTESKTALCIACSSSQAMLTRCQKLDFLQQCIKVNVKKVVVKFLQGSVVT